jgi:hypothetical protein
LRGSGRTWGEVGDEKSSDSISTEDFMTKGGNKGVIREFLGSFFSLDMYYN